ncbi:hypothetical protein H310_11045 [Aphanomyces invadans]|uniref:Uncharacterized protein n=1 Tax=Aphanomyces invadans TaxID=157072 RepID=A0A024TN76_9STRA|nr:hypothetical protein H310_11045 [Aphanomyces invadans]ETV95615.1 hypothetical protein H310_11045 [Aphanomyces invadans]|eukprot:XP_008875808.1 hypothetical protein H310_11045 [Aphanomyces invadans]
MANAEKWEAVGHPVVRQLHDALCNQEAHILATNSNSNRSGNLLSHPQLLRAVELEDLLVKKINVWVGEKKGRDFINDPAAMAEYTKVASLLRAAIESTDDANKSFWQKDVVAPAPAKGILEQLFQPSWMSLPQAVSASSPGGHSKDEKKHKKHKKEKKSKKSKKSSKKDDDDGGDASGAARFHPYANNPIGNVTRALMQNMDT